MKRNISSLVTACSIIASVVAQQNTFEDIFEEEEDPILQDIWPRYDTTDFLSIPEGSTAYNNPEYWQDGTFSTVTNIVGD